MFANKSLKKDLLNHSIVKRKNLFVFQQNPLLVTPIFDSDGVSAIPILLFMNILVMLPPCFICGEKGQNKNILYITIFTGVVYILSKNRIIFHRSTYCYTSCLFITFCKRLLHCYPERSSYTDSVIVYMSCNYDAISKAWCSKDAVCKLHGKSI